MERGEGEEGEDDLESGEGRRGEVAGGETEDDRKDDRVKCAIVGGRDMPGRRSTEVRGDGTASEHYRAEGQVWGVLDGLGVVETSGEDALPDSGRSLSSHELS